ncbi:hypothetical protein [Spirochaeta thermophila]|nr:hypothetical protein [Spirochaeta thermophila]
MRLCPPAMVFLLCVLTVPGVFAEQDPLLIPLRPHTVSTAGAGWLFDEGYASFFANPAMLPEDGSDLTLLDASVWLHEDPLHTVDTLAALLLADEGEALLPSLEEQLEVTGLGAGSHLGLGYAGGGLGLGLSVTTDSFFWGTSIPSHVHGVILGEYSFFLGGAFSFDLGTMQVRMGTDVRPFMRAYAPLDEEEAGALFASLLDLPSSGTFGDAANTLAGYGVAWDVGIVLALPGPFALALVVRDVGGTRISYTRTSFDRAKDAFLRMGVPEGGEGVGDEYTIPMGVSAGLRWAPDTDEAWAPRLFVSVGPFSGDWEGLPDAVRVGAEVTILRTFTLSAGYGSGALSGGLGLDMGVFEVDLGTGFPLRESGERDSLSLSGISLGVRLGLP